jgi:membrane-associated phospholipid phosphatase
MGDGAHPRGDAAVGHRVAADLEETMIGVPPQMPSLRRVARASLIGLGILALFFFIDHEIALFGASLPWAFHDVALILTEFGEGQWIIVPSVVLFVYGWRTSRDNLARWAFLLGVTVAVSGGLANALKIVFGRWRPAAFISGDLSGFEWFEKGWVRASFPSGHATTAAAASLVLAIWFPRLRWPILMLGVAIAATRIVLEAHYLTDVIAGWLLGASCVMAALWIWWKVHPLSVPRAMDIGWPRSPTAIAWTAIGAGTLLRVLVGVWLPLGIDEAYEVGACRSVTLSGFDHPPLVYLLARAGLALCGSGPVEAIWIRLPFILLFAFTTWMAWRTARLLFSPQAGAWTAVLLNVSALFAVALGGWALPDGPLLAALMVMAWALARGGVLGALQVEHAQPWSAWTTWIVAGAALGAAGLAKYQAALAGIGVLLFLLTTREGRQLLRHPAPWVGAATALAVISPVLIWNAMNDWASFRFQGARAATDGGFHPLRVLESLGAQAGIILPWIWAPLLFEMVKALRRGPRVNAMARSTWFFACMTLVPVTTFLLIAAWSPKGLPHWPAIGYLFAFPLLGLATAHELAHGKRALVRGWLAFSVIVLLVVVPIGVSQAANGWILRAIPAAAATAVKDPTLEALPWNAVRTFVTRRASERAAFAANQPPFVPPPAVHTLGADEVDAAGVPCSDEMPTALAVLPPVRDVLAPPPPTPSTWERKPPKVTRPPRAPDPQPPLPELDADILVRCGDEGVAHDRFFAAAINWRDAGKLATALHGTNIDVACLSSDARQFGWLHRDRDLVGRDALLFVSSDQVDGAMRELAPRFASLAPIAVLRLNRGSSIAQTLTVLCAINYGGEAR